MQKILEELGEKEYLQLKFLIKYDQNRVIDRVLNMLVIAFKIKQRSDLNDLDLKEKMENLTVNDLDD